MKTSALFLFAAVTGIGIACGGPAKDPYAIHVPPPASGAPPLEIVPGPTQDAPVAAAPAQAPPGDVCGKIPATRGTVPHRDPRAGSVKSIAGQMTEQSAQAKRLFDGEKWADAELALKRVADGETGDDEGNKQLADYHRAIVLFRLKRYDEAAARFRAFSRNPGHLKFFESLLWIVKLARDEPKVVRLEDVALYTPEEVARFDNPNQRDTLGGAAYLVGHERYDEGNLSEAQKYFEIARRVGPWPKEAEKCLARVQQTMPGGKH